MQIAEARQDGIAILAPAGRIDSTTAPALEQRLTALVASGERRIIVDFSGVEYISSAGLRVLLLLARRVRDADARLGLCGMGTAVRQVFQLAGFLPLFVIHDTRDAAIEQIAGP